MTPVRVTSTLIRGRCWICGQTWSATHPPDARLETWAAERLAERICDWCMSGFTWWEPEE